MDIEVDKLTEQYTLKIPEVLKVGVSSLPPNEKKQLNLKLMIDIAKAIHNNKFKPETYLTARDN